MHNRSLIATFFFSGRSPEGGLITELSLVIILLLILAPLAGTYIARVIQGERTMLHPLFGWLERLCYKVSGIDSQQEMPWQTYTKTLVIFNVIGFIALFLLLLLQGVLPLNPQNFAGVSWPLAFNITSSFTTNTNWQSYTPESTLSYLSQMLGLAVQNFLSAATGGCALIALIRGLTRKTCATIGNFWTDLVRQIVYLLLPLSIIMALFLVYTGSVQSFSPYVEVETMEGAKQTIPLGPCASQVAIKQLGTNGGGFFGANSAHPYENPSSWSNFLEHFAILFIPAALVFTYGHMIGSNKHGWLLFGVMMVVWLIGLGISFYSEHTYNPILGTNSVLEGKETRCGIKESTLWTVSTTCTANGSNNAMISSLSPLAEAIPMLNIMLGELIFGGVGVGMCSMIMFVLLTIFLAGLMIGRTPEYFGKKIEKAEMRWVAIAVLLPGVLILIGSGISAILPIATSSLSTSGPHGLSELVYAFTSCTGNNGSGFGGISANTNYFNIILGFIMLLGRATVIFPSLAVAGLLAQKKTIPPSSGTFSADTLLFSVLLFFTILLIGALSFSPVQILGPIVEHLLMKLNHGMP